MDIELELAGMRLFQLTSGWLLGTELDYHLDIIDFGKVTNETKRMSEEDEVKAGDVAFLAGVTFEFYVPCVKSIHRWQNRRRKAGERVTGFLSPEDEIRLAEYARR